MKPYYERDGIQIWHGDCREVLPALSGVTAIVSDPPYGLAFMGKAWDRGVPGEEFWRLAGAASLPGAALLAFGGTRTFHRLACAIEDAGWEIRDCLSWLYGQGFPKSLDVSKAIDKAAGAEGSYGAPKSAAHAGWIDRGRMRGAEGNDGWQRPAHQDVDAVDRSARRYEPANATARVWSGYGTALKPAWEPVLLARKPLDGTVAENALAHGCGALAIDRCRIELAADESAEELTARSGGVRGFADRYVGGKAKGAPPTDMSKGRWPANVALDEDAARVLDEQSGDTTSTDRPRNNGEFKSVAKGRELPHVTYGHADSGGASRFFYTSKANGEDRGQDNDHPTVKPIALMRWLVRLVSPPTGGLILDPFMGSGTTLVAAREEHVWAIGIEIEERYCEIAAKRLAQGVLNFEGSTP